MRGQEKTSLREVTEPVNRDRHVADPDNSCIDLETDSNPGEKEQTLKLAYTMAKNKTEASVGPRDLRSTREVTFSHRADRAHKTQSINPETGQVYS